MKGVLDGANGHVDHARRGGSRDEMNTPLNDPTNTIGIVWLVMSGNGIVVRTRSTRRRNVFCLRDNGGSNDLSTVVSIVVSRFLLAGLWGKDSEN